MQFKNQNYGRKFGVSSFSLTSDLLNYPELLSGSPKGEHSKLGRCLTNLSHLPYNTS